MMKKDKNVYKTLNYIKHFLILASSGNGYVSIFAFVSLIHIPIGITSSAIGWTICATFAEIKK